MPDRSERLKHFLLPTRRITRRIDFTAPPPRRDPARRPAFPQRPDRARHARSLLEEVTRAREEIEELDAEREEAGLDDVAGAVIDVRFIPNADFKLQSLTDERAGIELLSVKDLSGSLANATLFVPEGKLTVLERKIDAHRATARAASRRAACGERSFSTQSTFKLSRTRSSCADSEAPTIS